MAKMAELSATPLADFSDEWAPLQQVSTMRAELIGHFQPCMTDIYLHI